MSRTRFVRLEASRQLGHSVLKVNDQAVWCQAAVTKYEIGEKAIINCFRRLGYNVEIKREGKVNVLPPFSRGECDRL